MLPSNRIDGTDFLSLLQKYGLEPTVQTDNQRAQRRGCRKSSVFLSRETGESVCGYNGYQGNTVETHPLPTPAAPNTPALPLPRG